MKWCVCNVHDVFFLFDKRTGAVMKRGTLGLWGERQGLTVVVDNSRPRDEFRRGRPRNRENRDGGCRDQVSLAKRLRRERREQRDRARYRLYPSRNQSSIMPGRPWAPGHGRREVSRSQKDRENCQERGKAWGRDARQRGRCREDTHGRPGVGISRGQELSTHVQGIVRIGQRICQLQQGMQQVVRREYPRLHQCEECTSVDEPSQVIWGSFNQLRGYGGTLPSHEQMIGGASTSNCVYEPSQVITTSFA